MAEIPYIKLTEMLAREVVRLCKVSTERVEKLFDNEKKRHEFFNGVHRTCFRFTKKLTNEELGTIVGNAKYKEEVVLFEKAEEVINLRGQWNCFSKFLPIDFELRNSSGREILEYVAASEILCCVWNVVIWDYVSRVRTREK